MIFDGYAHSCASVTWFMSHVDFMPVIECGLLCFYVYDVYDFFQMDMEMGT